MTTRHALEEWTIIPDEGDSLGSIVTSLTTLGIAGTLNLETSLSAEVELLLVDNQTSMKHNYNIAPSLIVTPSTMTISSAVSDSIPIPQVDDAETKHSGFNLTLPDWGTTHIIDLKF